MHTIADRRLLMLRPEDILIPAQRMNRVYDDYELKRLADSVAANGLVEPISVRKTAAGYELIAGGRRLLAARLAGLRRIPCALHRIDDVTADFYAVVENLQRRAPDFFEEAADIQTLLERYGLTQTEAAVRLGIAQSTLAARLRLMSLAPELRRRITAAGLTERHARALLRVPSAKRAETLDQILAEGLTLRQTEELIERVLHPAARPAEPSEPVRKIVIGDVRIFANSLTKLVGTLQSAGFDAQTRKSETEKYIEYKVRIRKEGQPPVDRQLRIC